MSNKIRDGIVFDPAVYMMNDKKTAYPFYLRIFQLLAILTGSYSMIAIFIDCFSLKVSSNLILAAIILSGFAFFLLFLYPAYDAVKLIFASAVYLLMLYRWFRKLQNGIYLIENAIIEQAGSYYGFPAFRFQAQYGSAEEDITLLIIMILIPIVAILSLAVIRNKITGLCYITMVLPVAASFAFGVTPPEVCMITYVLVLLFLSKSNGYGHTDAGRNHKSIQYRVNNQAAIVLCLLALLLFFSVKLFVPKDKYEGYEEIREAKAKIQNFLFDFSLRDFTGNITDMNFKLMPRESSGTGGLSRGELGQIDRVIYRETEHLVVTAPLQSLSEGIYLKGYVGSVYTGDSWNGHSKEINNRYRTLMENIPGDRFQPAGISSLFFKNLSMEPDPGRSPGLKSYFTFSKGEISLEYKQADRKQIYAPSFTDFSDMEEVKFEQDLYARPSVAMEKQEYEYFYNLTLQPEMFWSSSSLNPQLKDFMEYERQYRQFVYDTYTELPDEGLERIKKDFSRETLKDKADTLREAVSYVKNYLEENTRYTLSPGKLPKGKDFAEYFLYEKKAGYCSHYASAAVLMLRAMGYSARYVEGYAVSTSDIVEYKPVDTLAATVYTDRSATTNYDSMVQVSVKDYNAHAWTEVYIDGCGWFPVEFTPGSGMEYTQETIEDMELFGQDIMEDGEPAVPPTQIPQEPTKAPTQEPTEVPGGNAPDTYDGGNDDITGADKKTNTLKQERQSRRYRIVLGIAVGVLIPAAVVYLVIYRRRKKPLEAQGINCKALFVYTKIEKLLSLCRAWPRKRGCLEDNEAYVMKNCSYVREEDLAVCMDTARKARFGRNSISQDEYRGIEQFYYNLQGDIFKKSSPLRRLYFRLLMSL